MRRLDRWLSPGVRYEVDPSARDCARCGYPFPGGIHGAPAPCAECGAPLDPAILGTIRPRGVHRWSAAAMRAPGVPMLALTVLACTTVAIGNCVPEGYVPLLFGGMGAMLVLAGLWALRAFVAGITAIRPGLVPAVFMQPGWWAIPALGVALAMLSLSRLPMAATFALQRTNLAAAAAGRHDARLVVLPGVAIYMPRALDRLGRTSGFIEPAWVEGGAAFLVPGTGMFFEQGCYFHLPAMPPESAPAFLVPLGGGWYAGRHED